MSLPPALRMLLALAVAIAVWQFLRRGIQEDSMGTQKQRKPGKRPLPQDDPRDYQ